MRNEGQIAKKNKNLFIQFKIIGRSQIIK